MLTHENGVLLKFRHELSRIGRVHSLKSLGYQRIGKPKSAACDELKEKPSSRFENATDFRQRLPPVWLNMNGSDVEYSVERCILRFQERDISDAESNLIVYISGKPPAGSLDHSRVQVYPFNLSRFESFQN